MRQELHDYFVYPRIVKSGELTEIAIHPRGRHALDEDPAGGRSESIELTVIPLEMFNTPDADGRRYPVVTARFERGAYRFKWRFDGEQEHYLKFKRRNRYAWGVREQAVRLSVYSLEADLYALRPYRGDLHIHSCESDGREEPCVVAANYRTYGYDFMALTDHGRMYPSIEVCQRFAGIPGGMLVMQGEEVHTDINHIHLVNFGGLSSVNDWANRDCTGEYMRLIHERMAIQEPLPEGVDATEFASYGVLCDKIREVGGLAIYPHPHWIENAYHVRDCMTWELFRAQPFDAFELLGGQTVQENNMQLMIYAEARARGYEFPVVGSSDSHNSTNTSDWQDRTALEQATIVLSPTLEREAILDSVRSGHSVAVAQYRGEQARVYGVYRLVKYGMFLMSEYFPQHDELCAIEGALIKKLLEGEDYALPMLEQFKTAVSEFTRRCFEGRERTWEDMIP